MGSNPTAAELAAIAAPFDAALAALVTAEAAIRAIPGVGSIGDARCFMAEDLSCVTSQVAHARRNALRRAQGYVPPALLVAVADVPAPPPARPAQP